MNRISYAPNISGFGHNCDYDQSCNDCQHIAQRRIYLRCVRESELNRKGIENRSKYARDEKEDIHGVNSPVKSSSR